MNGYKKSDADFSTSLIISYELFMEFHLIFVSS